MIELLGTTPAENELVRMVGLVPCFEQEWPRIPVQAVIDFAEGFNYRDLSVSFRGRRHQLDAHTIRSAFALPPNAGSTESQLSVKFIKHMFSDRSYGNRLTLDKYNEPYTHWIPVI